MEDAVGAAIFDCNAFDVLSQPDNTAKGKGVHKVSREDLLKTLQIQTIVHAKDAQVSKPSMSELEEMERIQKARRLALSAPRPASDAAELRGAGAVGSLRLTPARTYLPLAPPDADSKTIIYPYAAASVLVFQLRGDGGWNLALWRSTVTGEWGAPQANFAARHEVSAARPHALRSAAAEALGEQSCGLLRPAPGATPAVLRDGASASVSWDGGPHLDADHRPRTLHQLFALRVDGLAPTDLRANRAAVQRNLAAAPAAMADAAHGPPWLEYDDLTFVSVESLVAATAAAASAGVREASTVTDVEGCVCPCRRLVAILARPVVPSPLTPPLPGADPGAPRGGVVSELVAKLDAEIKGSSGTVCGLVAAPAGSGAASAPPSTENSMQKYVSAKWFSAPSQENKPEVVEETTVQTLLHRHPDLDGSLLAGCHTVPLVSVSTVIKRSELW